MTTPVSNPEIICRPSTWLDIFTFFILNYGLHAITIPTRPGLLGKEAIVLLMYTISSPYGHMMVSIGKIVRFSKPWKTELEQAFQSRAVCVLVKFEKGEVVAPTALKGVKNWEVGTILRP
jgi:hypothetical protein